MGSSVMTISTEDLRKLVSEATIAAESFSGELADEARSYLILGAIAAELITARAKLEAAEKLAAFAKAIDPRQTGFMESMNWDAYAEAQRDRRISLAAWEAAK